MKRCPSAVVVWSFLLLCNKVLRFVLCLALYLIFRRALRLKNVKSVPFYCAKLARLRSLTILCIILMVWNCNSRVCWHNVSMCNKWGRAIATSWARRILKPCSSVDIEWNGRCSFLVLHPSHRVSSVRICSVFCQSFSFVLFFHCSCSSWDAYSRYSTASLFTTSIVSVSESHLTLPKSWVMKVNVGTVQSFSNFWE